MRTELPVERLQRRLGADPETDSRAEPTDESEDATDDDQNSLLPRWLPDASERRGWVAKMRADPGRAGVIALAIVAALAVLVTVFTLVRDRPAPVMSAKLPPVEKAATVGPRSSASPGAGQPTGTDRPMVVSVVGLVHTPGLVTLAPGARIADALQAAGGPVNGADIIGLNMARPVGDGEQIVVGLAPVPRQPKALGSFGGVGRLSGTGAGRPGFGDAEAEAR